MFSSGGSYSWLSPAWSHAGCGGSLINSIDLHPGRGKSSKPNHHQLIGRNSTGLHRAKVGYISWNCRHHPLTHTQAQLTRTAALPVKRTRRMDIPRSRGRTIGRLDQSPHLREGGGHATRGGERRTTIRFEYHEPSFRFDKLPRKNGERANVENPLAKAHRLFPGRSHDKSRRYSESRLGSERLV